MDSHTLCPSIEADASDVLSPPGFDTPSFVAAPPEWAQHARNTYSQCGEDGILEELFRRIGTTNRTCFEVGASNGRWCSNTRKLIDAGWTGYLIECDPKRFAELEQLRGDNVHPIFRKVGIDGDSSLDSVLSDAGCPREIDLGVIDVDGPDFYIFNSLVHCRPRVLVVEYDPAVDIDYTPERDGFGQAGFRAMVVIGQTKGYALVATTRFNLIFVAIECAPRLQVEEIPLMLNLGGATGPQLPGYTVVDRKVGTEVYPLDFPDGCAAVVRASHVLEHLSHRDTIKAVRDWARVLKPGGTLRIAVPSYEWVVLQHTEGVKDPLLEMYLMGGQTDGDDYHKALFTESKLRLLMRLAGLRKVRAWSSEIPDCATLPVSLNLEGTKPVPVAVRGVYAVMSVPRYGATAAYDVIARACRLAGDVPIRTAWGAYFHEVLSLGIHDILADSPDTKYVLTIDYDSVFSHEDICELYQLMEDHPEADAVCPVQIGRVANQAMMVVTDENGKHATRVNQEWVEQDLGRIESGHFGLTMIRADALRKLKRPWFVAIPSNEGNWWGDGYVSADVNFWRQFTAQGFKLFSANQIPLGHLQEQLLWADRQLQCVTQEISEYRRMGQPQEVWR